MGCAHAKPTCRCGGEIIMSNRPNRIPRYSYDCSKCHQIYSEYEYNIKVKEIKEKELK